MAKWRQWDICVRGCRRCFRLDSDRGSPPVDRRLSFARLLRVRERGAPGYTAPGLRPCSPTVSVILLILAFAAGGMCDPISGRSRKLGWAENARDGRAWQNFVGNLQASSHRSDRIRYRLHRTHSSWLRDMAVVALLAALSYILLSAREGIALGRRLGSGDGVHLIPIEAALLIYPRILSHEPSIGCASFSFSFPWRRRNTIQGGYGPAIQGGRRVFAARTPLEPAPVCLSFKASPENFAGYSYLYPHLPARLTWRGQWVAPAKLKGMTCLAGELGQRLLAFESYDNGLREAFRENPRSAVSARAEALRGARREDEKKPSEKETPA